MNKNNFIKKFFVWIFKDELEQLNLKLKEANSTILKLQDTKERILNVLDNIDVSVDVHQYHHRSKSWAVISLQGNRTDYIKFVDLGTSDILEIGRFLRKYERDANIKIDAAPEASHFLKIARQNNF